MAVVFYVLILNELRSDEGKSFEGAGTRRAAAWATGREGKKIREATARKRSYHRSVLLIMHCWRLLKLNTYRFVYLLVVMRGCY